MKNKLPLFGWVIMLLTGLTGVAAEKSASGSFVTVRAEAQELARIGEEDFRGVSADRRPVSYKIKPKKGWKLQSPKNGKLDLSTGEMSSYAVTSLMGEDNGTGTVHTCEFPLNVVTNHISAPTVSACLLADGAYQVVTNGTVNASLSFNGGSIVTKKGEHIRRENILPCIYCGKEYPNAEEQVYPISTDPDILNWNWSVQRRGGGFFSSGTASGQSFSETLTLNSAGTYDVSAVVTGTVSWCTQCVCSATATTNCILSSTPKIVTCTVVTEPQNRDRKLLGLGEEVTLTLVPAMEDVSWVITTGIGRIQVNDFSAKFIAPNMPCEKTTVTVTYTGGNASVDFETIKPSGIIFKNHDFNGFIPKNIPSETDRYFALSYRALVYVKPATVNFYKITLGEGAAKFMPSGSFEWKNKYDHVANNGHIVTPKVVAGFGSLLEVSDNIGFSSPNVPCDSGMGYWDLDWSYSNGSVTDEKIQTVRQQATLTIYPPQPGSTGTFGVTKGESGAEISTDNPTPRFPQ